ncbi:MAG TPA: hypothetical protein PLL77_14165 [Pyrinomonadaceae bacterium]|nr:hypothetical protein [Pyrinomonadaceae bacterium]
MASTRTVGFIIENVFEGDLAAISDSPPAGGGVAEGRGGGSSSHVGKKTKKDRPPNATNAMSDGNDSDI